jgi:hypothetical protein
MQHHVGRTAGSWENRRGRGALSMVGSQPGDERAEWRHGDCRPAAGPPIRGRLPRRRSCRKSYSVAEWRIDEAISDMETLDYDYHLFTELGSNQDRVVDGGGPTGYRLAQVELHPEAWAPHAVEVTVSEQPAPALSTDEAIDRMAALDVPFVFFLDRERGRGALVYHRYDGHYGLITPAERS